MRPITVKATHLPQLPWIIDIQPLLRELGLLDNELYTMVLTWTMNMDCGVPPMPTIG